MQKLKIVIFTQAGLSVYNQSLFRRLIEDPLVDVAAIVVDEHPWRSQSLLKRVRKLGLGYLWWKTGKRIREKASGLLWRIWLGDHRRRGGPSGWDELAKSGVQIYRTADIHNSATLDFIRSLQAELGIICGGRIIKDSVLSLPRLGTLNIHKRKTPDYRGGGAIGYWEILNHEKEIAVTIHYAVAKVDEGAVLAQQPIPIEPYDTLKSLAVKAGVTGSDLYYKVIRDFAQGKREGLPQDTSAGRTYRAASDYEEDMLERKLQRRARHARRRFGGYSRSASASRWIKYTIQYPFLIRKRNQLVAAGQAPVIVLFYHRVANDAGSPGTAPLDDFVHTMDLIRRHYPIISMEEAMRRLASGHNTEIAFVVTFDDGYRADLQTSIPWLRTVGIPATFYISIGHVLDGSSFQHDLRRGITDCQPMTVDELRTLPDSVISIGSHAWLHEDCGKIQGAELERAVVASKAKLGEILGREPETFAFPKGIKGVNIKREGWQLAASNYAAVCSAYSGYNFPKDGHLHIKRWGAPAHPIDVIRIMDGYTGLGDLKQGNLWTWKTSADLPY